MKRKKLPVIILSILFITIIFLTLLHDTSIKNRNPKDIENSCMVYYVLNIDGMKGLGHTAFLLIDENANGQFYSYNGMQYSLMECLMGKAGIGKMKVFSLSAEEVEQFLLTGDLMVEDAAECDNFDRALYRYISKADYEQIQESVARYIDVGNEYERLYAAAFHSNGEEHAAADKELQEFLGQTNLPKYQIYMHNCDVVARELIALIDEEVEIYNAENAKLMPSSNFIGMYNEFGETWGCQVLGADTTLEKLFWR